MPSAKGAGAAPAAPEQAKGVLAEIREWGDALVMAFLLAMFIRMFVVELFKIPSPSMTPTLLGTEMPRNGVGYRDINGDGKDDMLLYSSAFGREEFDVYLRENGTYHYAGRRRPDSARERERWLGAIQQYQDRIVVAKFLYWFKPPRRGDIAVFKVPEQIFEREKPIYIKRVAGLPGETLTIEPTQGPPGHEETMGYLVADGKRVEEPEFFKTQRYEYRLGGIAREERPDYTTYRDFGPMAQIDEMRVPQDGVFMFGDNTISSRDSRYWGKVPLSHLRGRAIFRFNWQYFPYIKEPGFLK